MTYKGQPTSRPPPRATLLKIMESTGLEETDQTRSIAPDLIDLFQVQGEESTSFSSVYTILNPNFFCLSLACPRTFRIGENARKG